MGARFPTAFSTTIIAFAAPPAESVVCTTPPLTLPFDGAIVFIGWYIKYTTGATGPTISYNIRRGTTNASPLVNAANQTCTELASINLARGGWMVDTAPGAGTPQYSLSCNVTNAATTPVSLEVCLVAFAL